MKKSLIALAVAGVFVAPVAMADVTIYGQANVSFDAVNNGVVAATTVANDAAAAAANAAVAAAATPQAYAAAVAAAAAANAAAAGSAQNTGSNHVASNASRIGFKGAEDLGGGTSAVWQIESLVAIDNSGAAGNGFATRNTFAGLSGESWGTVLLGRHDTPYKIATRGLDLFADTLADNRSLMGNTRGAGHDARLTDVAAYISPAMSGFTVAVATVAGAETAAAGGVGATKGGAWSLAGMYNAGPVNASLSYQVIDNGTAGTGTMGGILGAQAAPVDSKAKAWKLGGGYTMDALQLNAVYEKTSSSGATGIQNALDRSAWYLAGKYNVSASDAVKLAYTSAGNVGDGAGGTATDTSATQFSLGYDHSMSKRTTVYALYSKISNKDNNPAVAGSGAAYTFVNATVATSTTGAAGGVGSDPSVWSIGMKHTF